MAAFPALSALFAASLEALALMDAARGGTLSAVAFHAAASLVTAIGLKRRLVPAGGGWGWALLAGASFFLPLLGTLGCIGLAWALPARSMPPVMPACTLTPMPPLARLPVARDLGRALGRRDREERIGAVRAIPADDPATAGLLRQALRDADEEVRLLAHSKLEISTRAAWRRIERLTTQTSTAGSRRAALELQLGAEHWELVHQGLVEGEIREHILESALGHLRAALDGEAHRPSLHYLLGRVHLARGQGREAEAALKAALAAGMSGRTLAPWLAEAAFLDRRLQDVAGLFAAGTFGPAGRRLQEYWT
jgi:hypothetical protein